MPREKNSRKLNFKPIIKAFIPENEACSGITSLLHEEIEAIYLMDVLGLYQEDAAKSMEISRPTFTRIIKSARKKLATALTSGYKIILEDSKEDLIIAFCSDTIEAFHKIDPLQKYLHIFHINNKEIKLLATIENPVYTTNKKPASILPTTLLQYKVNVFISDKIGEGLKNSLLSRGIKPIIKNKIPSLETLIEYNFF